MYDYGDITDLLKFYLYKMASRSSLKVTLLCDQDQIVFAEKGFKQAFKWYLIQNFLMNGYKEIEDLLLGSKKTPGDRQRNFLHVTGWGLILCAHVKTSYRWLMVGHQVKEVPW
jgi:hypothetical protein